MKGIRKQFDQQMPRSQRWFGWTPPIGDVAELTCPVCGSINLHLEEVSLQPEVPLDDNGVRNPALAITFWCEGGPHSVVLTMKTRKGTTYAWAKGMPPLFHQSPNQGE